MLNSNAAMFKPLFPDMTQRVDKENAIAEKFWLQRAMETGKVEDDAASQVCEQEETPRCCNCAASLWRRESNGIINMLPSQASVKTSSTGFTGFSSKTSYLKTKLSALEELLLQVRTQPSHKYQVVFARAPLFGLVGVPLVRAVQSLPSRAMLQEKVKREQLEEELKKMKTTSGSPAAEAIAGSAAAGAA